MVFLFGHRRQLIVLLRERRRSQVSANCTCNARLNGKRANASFFTRTRFCGKELAVRRLIYVGQNFRSNCACMPTLGSAAASTVGTRLNTISIIHCRLEKSIRFPRFMFVTASQGKYAGYIWYLLYSKRKLRVTRNTTFTTVTFT